MNHFAHSVDDAMLTLQPVLIILALAAWGIAVAGVVSSRRIQSRGSPNRGRATLVLGFLMFGVVIVVELASAEFIKHVAWEEIRPKLFSNIESVSVNGGTVGDKNALIRALRETNSISSHHSHPTTEYRVTLSTSRGSLYLRLCRDSDNPTEYWVFYPGFHVTESNEVGRTFTDVLDRQ
jgi:hypothetical protein